jgi:multidrug efflux pump subunit AcrB
VAYADRQSRKVEAALQPYVDSGIVTDVFTIVGSWDPHRSMTEATLLPWEQRNISQIQLAKELNDKLSGLPGALVRIRQGNSLGVRGAGGGLELALQGSDYKEINAAAELLSAALLERVPEVEDVNIEFDTSQPELYFNIDRKKVNDLGVDMETISQTLQVMVDRTEVVELNIRDQIVPIVMASSRGAINDTGDLLNVFVTNSENELVPLNALISVEERGVAAQLDRHAQSRAIEINIGVPPGIPLGNVMDRIRTVAHDVLPSGTNILFVGEAAELTETSYQVTLTFLFAILIVFLVLSAQFESPGSALIVIFTVPFGLAAAVFALLLSGQSINLYSQIGLVMLVGIITKNAILLIEFMDQLRDEGRDVSTAILEGVDVRLRPVMMTVLSTVLGSLPLILSEGPGAEARNAIGWVVFGGVGLSALFTLYVAPLGYSLIAPHLNPRAHSERKLSAQLQKAGTGNV